MPSSQESRYFAPANGQEVDAQLDFWAQSVIIDNRTSSYLEVVPAKRWLDPGSGAGIPFRATQRAQLRWTAPPGKVQIAPVVGEQAQVRFFSNPYPPGIGLVTKQAISGITNNPTITQVERQVGGGGFVNSITVPATGTLQTLGTFNHIRIFFTVRSQVALNTDTLNLQINGDTANVY